MTDLTKEQRNTIADVRIRVANLRAGGIAPEDIAPALFREGWPVAAVKAAREDGNNG